MENYVSNEDYFEISRHIQKHHNIFYKFWEIGKPNFVSDTSTAYVSFTNEGELMEYCFNFDYWESLDNYQRSFVICHEILHLLLEHGLRGMDAFKSNSKLANIAMDIVDNHLLVNSYGFDRKKIKDDKKLCWVDTIFPESNVSEKESFETYFNLLKNNNDKNSSLSQQSPDDHSKMQGEKAKDISENFFNKINDMMDSLSDDEKKQIKDIIDSIPDSYKENSPAGSVAGNLKIQISANNVKPKKKWETVIKKWANYHITTSSKEQEQWARINRRFITLNSDFFIPTEMEIEAKSEDKKKIDVWFFQDTSGSCISFADRFFKAAKSLPKDKFNVRMFCFDTQVYETSLESGMLYGFGGTRFDIIESRIQGLMKSEKANYPKAIFVITDGLGNQVKPLYPQNWYWFLSTNFTSCIPKESNIFKLSDYE